MDNYELEYEKEVGHWNIIQLAIAYAIIIIFSAASFAIVYDTIFRWW
jgi:hypothetical protein